MTTAKRQQAVEHFMSKDKATVMLMSLKCGGVGLNLTRANNVVSLDLGDQKINCRCILLTRSVDI
jgi:SNF2 family DNA or RNA helicase